MAKKLAKVNKVNPAATPLTKVKRKKFKIAFGTRLDNNYCFKSNSPNNNAKEFQKFLEETVYKGLYISDVEDLFKRKRGPKDKAVLNVNDEDTNEDVEVEILHFGKDRKPFRIFGYYDKNKYFNVTKIDPKHNAHKQK